MNKKLNTEPYKGTRDFYPADMAIERYIFDTWATTAELFGFERYDASILEPSELYKSKGAENEEMVNEQTYTFTDRGDREVTLRPEMTPTVARMVAGRRRELSFPVRWYSIPNLFRYERPQRGRLREHWQLNCDMFGSDEYTADVELITLAYHVLKAFGAKDTDFEIRINDRALLNALFKNESFSDEQSRAMLALLDRKEKISNFEEQVHAVAGRHIAFPMHIPEDSTLAHIVQALTSLGITNVVFSPSTVRGFSYYTGTIFEIFDTDPKNNRSLIGGGRYDNLTALFGGDTIPGIGFGMGDVTMRDFLETHDLLPKDIHITAPTLIIIPTDSSLNLEGEKIAQSFRTTGIRTSVDISNKKIAKKLSSARDAGARFTLVIGENETTSQTFTLKELATKKETHGSLQELIQTIV
jgi:histidyl-tRNA synthetase